MSHKSSFIIIDSLKFFVFPKSSLSIIIECCIFFNSFYVQGGMKYIAFYQSGGGGEGGG